MTNNQLTDERIEKIAVWLATESHSLNLEMLTCLRELQERRKADSEPVAVVEPSDYVTAAQLVGEGPARKAVHELYEGALRIGDKLYRHAQPAPVVPDDIKLRELFDSWFASDCSFDRSPEASEEDNIAWRESYWYVWQRCRAAMLQELQKSAGEPNNCRSSENVQVVQDVSRCSTKAAPVLDSSPKTAESRCSKSPMWIGVDWAKGFEPGNSPVIPDGYVMVPKEPTEEMNKAGWAAMNEHDAINPTYRAMLAAAPAGIPMNSTKWIPVSERMPETDGNYWGWWSESKRQGPVWFIKSELQAQFQSHEITHWMPLPAAPQEVKGE
ncbi:DUF551 domain-containing protein [Raoultella terrigena]|uniref:DUF551 domain-containing protein n=1 Tax=Raoultella terrigena TaxID=577 RepID=UPI001F39999C|nr:DUF551 domain-containing protein [Raoultella terrigena]MCE9898993.1 DUF551 domain-containing protein [Raoultella terrigena]